jgi:class 3 adenylate cyclase
VSMPRFLIAAGSALTLAFFAAPVSAQDGGAVYSGGQQQNQLPEVATDPTRQNPDATAAIATARLPLRRLRNWRSGPRSSPRPPMSAAR